MRGLVLVAVVFAATAAAQGSFSFSDPPGDVTRSGDSYNGGGARGLDVVSAGFAENGRKAEFSLRMMDLDALSQELGKSGYHSQYALSFQVDATGREYSMRATHGGKEYTGRDGGWNFNIHDKANDEWPATQGRIIGNTIEWSVEWSELGLESQSSLSDWSVQTWASFADESSYGDWAESGFVHTLGEKPPEASTGPWWFAAGLLIAVGVVAFVVWAERRRR